MMNGWQFAQSRVLRLIVATAAIAAVLGCPDRTRHGDNDRTREGDAMDTLPCPHYNSRFFTGRGIDTTQFLAGRQMDIPEYNDCQRLLVNTSGGPDPKYTQLKFGHVAAIFARKDLNGAYQTASQIGDASKRSFFAALRKPDPASTRVTAIAVVWTTGPYAPLGVSAGFDCVVLQWEGPVGSSKPRNYHAWMVPVDLQQSCASPLDLPAAAAHYLGAVELPAQSDSTGADEIPPVARWDWDPRRGEQYVGIACPSGWCELYGEDPDHPHGHSGSRNYKVSGAMNLPGHAGRVVRQKGWYDEEYLASTVTTPGKPPELDGAGAFGTVFPVPELKGRTSNDYPVGKFVPVAWISISPASQGYSGKYGFSLNKAPPQRPDVNALFLCFDDGSNACKAKPKYKCSPTHDLTNGPSYYARLGASPDDPNATDFCVDYIATKGADTPGTVRWRWLDDDQTIWVSCPAGCCQLTKPR
jgi:hypothetical protein